MKLKLDIGSVKELVLQKGERVGLAIAVFLSFLILGYGVVTGLSSGGGNYQDNISQRNVRLKDKWKKEPPPPETQDDVKARTDVTWTHVLPDVKEPSPWVVLTDGVDSKRRNPAVLPIRTRETEIQMDYIRGPMLTYDNRPRDQKVNVLVPKGSAAAGTVDASRPAELLQPKRMVVVSAVFPLKDQLELVRHALRLYTIEEAMAAENAPVFLGLNVMRSEVLPGGQPKKWEPLYTFDPKKDMQKEVFFNVSESLTPVFRDGVIDEVNVALHSNFLSRGLSTPLPKLAFGKYPPIDLNGIQSPKMEGEQSAGTPAGPGLGKGGEGMPGKGPGMPGAGEGSGMPGAQGAEMDYRQVAWKELPNQDVAYRLMGQFYAFDPLGSLGARDIKAGGSGMGPGEGGMAGPGKPGGSMPPPGPGPGPGRGGEGLPGVGPGTAAATTLDIGNLLARFVDIDVEPGKTYRYSVMVVMMNPNYNKKEAVAFVSLASEKALYSPWATTPDITIPGDFFYYAYQWEGRLEAPVVSNGSEDRVPVLDAHPTTGRPSIQISLGQAPMQIHRWIGVAEGERERAIGGFAIGERILTHRGQTIGRPGFQVEMPVWNPQIPGFFLDGISPNKKGKIVYAAGKAPGIPINFQLQTGNPILIDFVEGNRGQRYVGKVGLADEVAQDVLVLTPEGKLIVRNARDDSENEPIRPGEKLLTDGQERRKRFEEWRDRLKVLRQGALPAGGQGPGGAGP